VGNPGNNSVHEEALGSSSVRGGAWVAVLFMGGEPSQPASQPALATDFLLFSFRRTKIKVKQKKL
jgi:hypothetical protein